jgi:hypothetical protein
MRGVNLLPFDLWHSLHYALPRHPLLWFTPMHTRSPDTPPQEPPLWWVLIIYYVMGVAAFALFIVWGLIGFPPETALLVGSTSVGALFTRSIATRISAESHLFDLLALTPSGLAGALWAICARHLRGDIHIGQAKQLVDSTHTFIALILIPLALINLLVMLSPFIQRYGPPDAVPIITLNMLFWLVLLRLDYLHGAVLAAFFGMIAPTFTRARLESGLVAVALFLLAQASIYALILAVGRLTIALEFHLTGQNLWWLASLTWVITFIIVRALAMLGVFWILAARLDVTRGDLRRLTKLSI